MWFIGVEVGQETSAPPPKKILDPPLRQMEVMICLQAVQLTATCSQHSLLLLSILQYAI